MTSTRAHRKQVKHYHEPGDFHELTFSCYRRLPLITNNAWRAMLSEAIDTATNRWQCQLNAFVFMPEHVHLLVYPLTTTPEIDALLKAIKQPYSSRIKQQLLDAKSPLLQRLTIRERPGVRVFRYWQEGPGYDRNLNTVNAVLSSIDYIHMNPVWRGLCQKPEQWKWSSASFYLSDGQAVHDDLPLLHRPPAELFTSLESSGRWYGLRGRPSGWG